MFKWFCSLFQSDRVHLQSEMVANLHPYPTPDTVTDWDDASLFTAAGCESALRYHRDGFETLNDSERSLCCLYLLESAVNNGGFGHWIESLCPSAAAETPRILRKIGATKMASLVADVLLPLGDTTEINSKDQWVEHYLSMPDETHEHWETRTRPFLELEDRFLDLAYSYARANWEGVRAAQQRS
ncbi:MAG: DUF4375 domain-containing protein [Pirellulaceae bacterium]|nr:DUF4375 domain-containing protein [Pirellulaceae bacterium]